jgi:hypothetical protein
MRRRDWLLLFAAYEGAPDGLDPIRFQKTSSCSPDVLACLSDRSTCSSPTTTAR